MSALSATTWILGTLLLSAGLFSLFKPERIKCGLAEFPRNVWPGRVLLAIDMVWAAYEVTTLHLGAFDAAKIQLYWIAPVLIVLGCRYMDEMLSVRALGGLLLLAAGPILNAARWNPSDWRLVITCLAYLWIIAGLFFLLEPWWFRRLTARTAGSCKSVRALGAFKTIAGVVLFALALWIY